VVETGGTEAMWQRPCDRQQSTEAMWAEARWTLARLQSPEGACIDDLSSRKPGSLLSAIHSRAFRWFSAAPLVFYISLSLICLNIFFVMFNLDKI
jgi:hypothetical protein